MRLIDADKLENDIAENITVKAVSRMLAIIQGQPTVKAIPIEWIKKWAMKNWVKSKKCEFDIIASKLIDDWLGEENGEKTV